MPRDTMSEQQINIQFVKEVEKHPSLYNFELPTYSRKDISDKAWEEVGKATNMTPSACRERWKNLRAVFMRNIKAMPKANGVKKPYYLADVMQFLIPFLRPLVAKEKQANEERKTERDNFLVEVDQIKLEVDDENYSDGWDGNMCVEEAVDTTQTRKRSAQDDGTPHYTKAARLSQPSSSTTMPDSEHVNSFLNSLIPELNEMNSTQFKNFKRRVLVLIDDIMSEVPELATCQLLPKMY